MIPEPKKSNSAMRIAGLFLTLGVLSLLYSVIFVSQIMAFIGLGLTFWGALFALARSGKYVESSLVDCTAKSSYSTIERMVTDLKLNGKGYYIPAYPEQSYLPQYLGKLKEPVVYISENFNGKPPIDELAAGKFLSEKTHGIFLTAPGAGLMAQMEKRLKLDFSRIGLLELPELVPRCLTEQFNLAKSVNLSFFENGANFEASGILYESLFRSEVPLQSVIILGCPVVSAVASACAKSSGKIVIIKELVLSPINCGVHAVFSFI